MISFRLLTRPRSMQFQNRIGSAGDHTWIYPSKIKEQWMRVIRIGAAQFKPEEPFNEPVALGLTFIFVQPKSNKDPFPMTRNYGDLSNLTKTLEDCLTGNFYVDDSLIVKKVEQKLWGPEDVIEINLAPIAEWNLLFNE